MNFKLFRNKESCLKDIDFYTSFAVEGDNNIKIIASATNSMIRKVSYIIKVDAYEVEDLTTSKKYKLDQNKIIFQPKYNADGTADNNMMIPYKKGSDGYIYPLKNVKLTKVNNYTIVNLYVNSEDEVKTQSRVEFTTLSEAKKALWT